MTHRLHLLRRLHDRLPFRRQEHLDKNYLHLAEGLGVRIVPETEVAEVRPLAGGGYELMTRRSTGLRHPKSRLTAGGVVFSGGVMGSVPLLMTCRQRGWLPNLSPRLGSLVRTNSEAILSIDSTDRSVDWTEEIAIRSGIYPAPGTHIEIVRYNKGSDVLFGRFTVATDGGGRIPRQLRFLANVVRHPRVRMTAGGVVFSGGVMGSVPLLMKCRQRGWLAKVRGVRQQTTPCVRPIPDADKDAYDVWHCQSGYHPKKAFIFLPVG